MLIKYAGFFCIYFIIIALIEIFNTTYYRLNILFNVNKNIYLLFITNKLILFAYIFLYVSLFTVNLLSFTKHKIEFILNIFRKKITPSICCFIVYRTYFDKLSNKISTFNIHCLTVNINKK